MMLQTFCGNWASRGLEVCVRILVERDFKYQVWDLCLGCLGVVMWVEKAVQSRLRRLEFLIFKRFVWNLRSNTQTGSVDRPHQPSGNERDRFFFSKNQNRDRYVEEPSYWILWLWCRHVFGVGGHSQTGLAILLSPKAREPNTP